MGFFVHEEVSFPRYGVSASNCYVTIKGSFSQIKVGAPGIAIYMPLTPYSNYTHNTYVLTAKFFVCTANNPELLPLQETTIYINSENSSENPMAAIYAAIKAEHFADKTFTDDL